MRRFADLALSTLRLVNVAQQCAASKPGKKQLVRKPSTESIEQEAPRRSQWLQPQVDSLVTGATLAMELIRYIYSNETNRLKPHL